MSDKGDAVLWVSSALEALRAELEEAWRSGTKHQVQFGIDEISLTLTVVASGKMAGGGKIRWYVIEAGGDVSHEKSSTQTLVLKLKPALVDPGTGRTWPLQVSGDQTEKGD
jgi:Trypsin-co-occurring domain 2